jgi:oligoendopeptidase F
VHGEEQGGGVDRGQGNDRRQPCARTRGERFLVRPAGERRRARAVAIRRGWLDARDICPRVAPVKSTRLICALTTAASLALAATTAPAKPDTRNRAEIPAKYKSDFTQIYPDWEAWATALKDMGMKMDAFAALQGTLAGGPAAVLKAYQAFDEIGMMEDKVYRYTALQRDVDLRNQDIAGKFQRVGAVAATFGTATAWFTPELLKVPQATMEQWIAGTPALAPYRFTILDNYRQQAHVLDEKGEKLLSFATRFDQTPRETFQELSTSDITFPEITLRDGKKVTVSPGAYQALLTTDYDQADRAKAFEAHLKTYAATANTYAAIYNGLLQCDWFNAQARNYPTTLDAALDVSAIPPAVVTTLVETVRAGTAPLQRYFKLRKKLLGLESYHLYDGQVPIFKSDKVYPYDESRDLVISSVETFGADYVAKYKKQMASGRVDVYETDGKRSGAYNGGVYGVGPYLLLNYTDTLNDVFTLAHEAGHAMHTILSYENQPYVTAECTIFVAEVASTTNERLLLKKLLETTTDPKERFLLLQHAVDAIVGTFYAQVLFADYELQAHRLVEQGQPITAEVLCGVYAKLLKDYYGDSVTMDDLYKYTWARVPHFFNSPYYVYQYATCFASSAQLFKAMTTGAAASRAAATERYQTRLKSGGTDYPMTQLQKAGVDLTKRETVQAVVDQMNELVSQLEMEAAKIK